MAWTNADLKIFAAGLAIGGEWNGHTPGNESFTTRIIQQYIITNNIFVSDITAPITSETIIDEIVEES